MSTDITAPDLQTEVPDIEACISFVAINRLIANRFASKAETLLELAQSLDDVDERIRIADLMQLAENRATMHASIASVQERDLGVKCHCSTMAETRN